MTREGPRALWVPLWPGDSAYSGLYLYATTLTRVPMLNGYSAWLDRSYLTEVYRPLEIVNLGLVGEAEAETLRRYRVRQLILDRDAFPLKVSAFGPALTLANLRASPYLEPVPTETSRPDAPRVPRPGNAARGTVRAAAPRVRSASSGRRSRSRATPAASSTIPTRRTDE